MRQAASAQPAASLVCWLAMPASSRWASSPGRTLLAGLVAALAALLTGTACYAVSLSMLFGAAVLTAGLTHAAGAELVLGPASLIALGLEAVVVTLAGAVVTVLLTRSATARPRWSPPLLAGLAAGAVYWGLAIASVQGDDRVALYLWPTHLESWMYTVLAQLLAVNLTAQQR